VTYDSVVWDFDGVLVDSRAESWHVASQILTLFNTSVNICSQETFRRYFINEGIVQQTETPILRDMHRLVMRTRTRHFRLFPVVEFVSRLTVPSEIITSGFASNARAVLAERAALFTTIRGHEEGSKRELLGTVSARAICVTDTIADIARCRELQRAVIAVGWGYDSAYALKEAQPHYFVHTASELHTLFTHLGLVRAGG
jgi:phosphoglycolate phosphatase-like HAD superfamily hydrolase